MSGPQGSDPTQPYPGSDQPADSGSESTPAATPDQSSWQPPSGDQSSSPWQTPAYTPQPQYPSYTAPPSTPATPPPSTPGYAAPQQPYGQQPTYPQTGAYGQPPQYGQTPPQYGQQPQYGQPPQYGQQYGQPQYGQQPQYNQYGQPVDYTQTGQYPQPQFGQPDDGSSKKSMAAIGTILGVLAAIIVAVVLVLGFWKPGFFMTTKLDVGKAQTGVQQILSDETNGYGAKNVKDVKCNNGQNPTVRKGDTFTCEVSIDGTKRQVTVTFQDDKGTYEVGRPK